MQLHLGQHLRRGVQRADFRVNSQQIQLQRHGRQALQQALDQDIVSNHDRPHLGLGGQKGSPQVQAFVLQQAHGEHGIAVSANPQFDVRMGKVPQQTVPKTAVEQWVAAEAALVQRVPGAGMRAQVQRQRMAMPVAHRATAVRRIAAYEGFGRPGGLMPGSGLEMRPAPGPACQPSRPVQRPTGFGGRATAAA